jgi:aerobic-type carbon monoxide dehydrogenase small subunit (CoxS/CutS family)
MKQQLNIVVNGEPYELFIEPKTLLVQVIREHLGLKGTHQACDSSSCGKSRQILFYSGNAGKREGDFDR